MFARVPAFAGRARTLSGRAGTTLLAVDRSALDAFRTAGGGELSLPVDEGAALELTLTPLEVLAPGAGVTFPDDAGSHPAPVDLSVYRGKVAGDPDSWAVLSLSPRGAMGTVYEHGRRWQLMPAERAAAGKSDIKKALSTFNFTQDGSMLVVTSKSPLPASIPTSATYSIECNVNNKAVPSSVNVSFQ